LQVVDARHITAEELKALAHPLRYRLLDALTERGPATASQLAAELGESSGATSYHLRQLARHGFIAEVPERARGRERWWRRVPGAIEIEGYAFRQQDDTRDAASTLIREIQRTRDERLRRWQDAGGERWGPDWVAASLESDAHLILTQAELRKLSRALLELVARYHALGEERRDAAPPGAAHVALQLFAFPTDPAADAPADEGAPARDGTAGDGGST
jgi:DNA-binding transcriptional ArsR family regulator